MNNIDKVAALYRAVIELIEEGVDINTVKVIDITQKAGIGKGTAYEYFSSKDEIIIRALLWDMEKLHDELKLLIVQAPDFKAQIKGVLDWIESNVSCRRSSVQFFKISGGAFEIRSSLQQELAKNNGEYKMFDKVFQPILRQMVSEGIIAENMPMMFVKMVLISNFVSFFMVISNEGGVYEVSVEELKDFIYRSIVKSLQA